MEWTIRKGLKKFKKVGEAAEQRKLNQLRTMINFPPMNVENMNEK